MSDNKFRYNEDKNLKDIYNHIEKTYSQHYSKSKHQAIEFIIDNGHGDGFCVGNIMKYAQRYGKKGDRTAQRSDLMKIIHYALLQLYIHDNKKVEER